MKIIITGASGFVGSALSNLFLLQQHQIIKINRKDYSLSINDFSSKFENADVVVNLAGATINKRWTRKYKREIYASRILTTRKIIEAISVCKIKPKILINASAIGLYDDIHTHDEQSTHLAYNFLSKVVRDWEHAANRAFEYGTQVYIFRFGIVISKNGGMLKKVLPIFKSGFGGKIGKGNQFFSFIHLSDLLNVFELAIKNFLPVGVYNLTSPEISTNLKFTKQYAQLLNRPHFFKVPKFVLKILYGEGANVLIGGQAAIPSMLLENGYKFKYEKLEDALKCEI